MRNKFLSIFLTLTSFTVFSQELAIRETLENPSKVINDGQIVLQVEGGQEPYTYKWSDQDTPLASNKASGLTEGIPYEVTVTDAAGLSVTKEYKIPAKSITEIFNGTTQPIVDAIGSVLFWDPFAAVGIYDPVIYDDNGEMLLHPNGDPMTAAVPFIVIWLVIGGIFFTFRMGFINLRGFRHSLQLARGKYDQHDAPGQVTHFQALATAVSGTVGLGNIAGVAIAISLGGPGATFWMMLAGFVGMSSKFVECSLGVKYREVTEDGRVFGGPMSYLVKGLKVRGMEKFGKVLAVVFAVLCIGASFGAGNMFQSNQAFDQMQGQFPALEGNGFWFGVIMAIMVGAVIIGGIKSIAKVTSKVVPVMASIYVASALLIIFLNISHVGEAFTEIFNGAFNADALKGGLVGVMIQGLRRGAFSNEAGVGSAAIAHSTVKTRNPVSEGFVGLLEPFIDTIVVCTLTALVLIFTGVYHESEGLGGAQLTSQAFGSVISWFPYVLAIAIFLFAFSTAISWSYYGMRAATFLFGKSKKVELVYKILFLMFVVLGASISLGAVLEFSDMMLLAMALPNIIGLYIMSGEVRKDMKEYIRKLRANELFKKPKQVKATVRAGEQQD
ncbi:amino acid carrier protein [Sinomicrobium weinanense]|uniref:Amino acid carrier protein n=1 Tax=Sinomicrobium weinanense TaxID=2842200 RepID=A0A926JS43_9FLAO|nr:amino acid carrier protein [Sinomicrobium weinanense]MBC9796502.1 amino acid carrier protein [Sinomicrobium weinanense]MBU3123518.1 amino acid carrier protein [Sinomicrobium weinanense]